MDRRGRAVWETRTLADGRTVPVFVLANSPASRRFLLTNPDGYSLTYNGFVMTVRNAVRMAGRPWPPTHCPEPTGCKVSSGATAAQIRKSAPSPPPCRPRHSGETQQLSPTRMVGCRTIGRTCSGSSARSDLPRTGLAIGASFRTSAENRGRRRRSCAAQGDQRILLEPRGSRRLSSQSLLDVHVSKPISFGRMGHVELLLDVLNVLNDTDEESLATDDLFSPELWTTEHLH